MCGIFGHFSGRPLTDLAQLYAVGNSQQQRGHHAHGIAYLMEDGEIAGVKRPGSIIDHPGTMTVSGQSIALIGHTRWATHGSVEDNRNNHPHRFAYRGNPAYLVHNGIIGNYLSIAAERNLRLVTECDSEVVARHIESGKGPIIDRVVAAVKDIDPYAPFAAAILTPDALILARRGNPIYWSQDDDHSWFASTKDALRGTVYTVPNNRVYLIPMRREGKVIIRKLPKRQASTRVFLGSDHFTEEA